MYLVLVVGDTACDESSLPSLTSVVEQMLFDIMIEGYIDLKSSTTTQGSTPGSTSCT